MAMTATAAEKTSVEGTNIISEKIKLYLKNKNDKLFGTDEDAADTTKIIAIMRGMRAIIKQQERKIQTVAAASTATSQLSNWTTAESAATPTTRNRISENAKTMKVTGDKEDEQVKTIDDADDVEIATRATTTTMALMNVCLICRQHMLECCLRCCQYYTKTAATKSTDYNSNRKRKNSFKNNNNNNHNNYKCTTTTTATTTTVNNLCRRQNHCQDDRNMTATDNSTNCSSSRSCSCWQQKSSSCATLLTTSPSSTTAATIKPSLSSSLTTSESASPSSPPITELSCYYCTCNENVELLSLCNCNNVTATIKTTIPSPKPIATATVSTTTTSVVNNLPTATVHELSRTTAVKKLIIASTNASLALILPQPTKIVFSTAAAEAISWTKCFPFPWLRRSSPITGSTTASATSSPMSSLLSETTLLLTFNNFAKKHSAGANDKHQINTTTTAKLFTTTTKTNKRKSANNKTATKMSRKCCILLRNTLRTFQFLIYYIHMQLICPIFNIKTNNNKFISNNHNKKRQQRPPLLRLKFRRNSYLNNATNIFNNNTKIINTNNNNLNNNVRNTSHILQQQKQQQQRYHHQHHHKHHQHQQQQQLQLQLQQNELTTHHPMPHEKQKQKQTQQQQLYYFKTPNLSFLYMILTILSFLSIFLPLTHAQQTFAMQHITPTQTSDVTLTRNETVCRSMDIRNFPNETRQLENCTVIEGFLVLTLVNTQQSQQLIDFTETFPLLTEVTEYVIVYRVHNLRSLAQIFPNLSIIRGTALFDGYAMVIHSNPHLEELGLFKLTTIARGGIRIENNLSLCFIHTIDWTQIVANVTDNLILSNRDKIECPKCPGDSKSVSQDGSGGLESGLMCKEHEGRRFCWNSKSCQKICPERCRGNCVDEKTCCNDACLGGCSAENLDICISCRYFSISNNKCIQKCPDDYYKYQDRRCITEESCARIGTKFENNMSESLVAYEGQCSTRCPEGGFIKKGSTCEKCGDKCIKECKGGVIDSVQSAKEYTGCTHIVKDGLTISIRRAGRHLMEDLESLSSIEVINTYLKVQHTSGMTSLSFFRNLKKIRGETLAENKFALYVLENMDLETLWAPDQIVRIEDGRVFFHFNPKLCYEEINNLRKMLKNDTKFDQNEVATDSNGSKGSCNTELLNTTVISITQEMAVVSISNPLTFEDERTFIGYQFFYIEDRYQNATKFEERVCEDRWVASDPTKDTKYIFQGLKPFTQYGYYVKTWTISSEKRNAQSSIHYFRTKSAQPKKVRKVNAYAISSSEIVIHWLPPIETNGNLTKFKVRAVLDKRSQKLESRNYCKDPAQIDKDEDDLKYSIATVTDKPQVPSNCDCSKDGMEGGEHEVVDTIEARRVDTMEFENTLQNFIYVKHTNDTEKKQKNNNGADGKNGDAAMRRRRDLDDFPQDSFIIRHMRSLPVEDQLDNRFNSNSISGSITTTNTPPPAAAAKSSITNTASINETRMDPNGEYYEVVVDTVNSTTNKYVFKKLKHFARYTLDVEACRQPETDATERECSDVQQWDVRTKKMDNVDKVENLVVKLEATNTSRSNLRISWDPPERPNDDVVSYTIAYIMLAQDAVEEKKCITDADYRNMSIMGYVLSGLPTGNYSIKVRANSLAGDGIFSEPVYIYIPPTGISDAAIIIICVLVPLLIILIVALIIYLRKRMLAPPSDLKIFPTVNPYYISLQYIPDDWEVSRDRVLQLSPLGQGSFGMVYEGILKGYNNSNEDTPCAIKTVNENATDRERMNFLNEASVMKQFDTYHVVRLLGVCSVGQPALVVMELMKNGDLKTYLRAHRPDERDNDGVVLSIMERAGGDGPLQPPPLSRIYQMAIEIADGMAYLAAKKFVHRDLAARNCMVAIDLTVKIGDFGMTRDIYETDYYRKGTKGLLPVRWMPPESLRDGVYASSSDVFSYGVVLWEMATLASQPYPGFSNDQVLRYVIEGGVMERPENCPDKLYRLMHRCWHHRPSARPTFMDIIRYLLEFADENFHQVSFFYSEEGQQVVAKERAENMQSSGDIFNDRDNDMDDVTTPLRVDEYNDYKLNMDNNSSVENHGDSPMVMDDDHPRSPYSFGSAVIASYNISQASHNNPTTLSSVPSTSAGIISSGGGGGVAPTHHLHYPSSSSSQQALHHQQRMPYTGGRYHRVSGGTDGGGEEASAYVQPDFDPHDFEEDGEEKGGASKSLDADERGYEIYDPSPNYRQHGPYNANVDDEEDFDGIIGSSGPASGGRNLLPRHKRGHRVPVIMPMSSSVPDEAIGAPISSSLHPSTASAASSNTSSTTATTGKYPSLKKAVAETVQNVGNTLLPFRFRNRRFFNHKRSGSNASHKSTSSNPNSASSSGAAASNSNANLTGAATAAASSVSGRGRSVSGQNLGTIESGGSGSASSYVAAPRFFTSSANSENPNYKPLDESTYVACISEAAGENVKTPAKSTAATTTSKGKTGKPPSSVFTTSVNPNYQLLDETLNATLSPTKSTSGTTLAYASENPNYALTAAAATTASATITETQPPLYTSTNPNYVMMNEPPPHQQQQQQEQQSKGSITSGVTSTTEPFVHVSVNPNYQMMGPPAVTSVTSQQKQTPFSIFTSSSATQVAPPAPSKSHECLRNSATSSSTTSADDDDEHDDDDDHDDQHADNIKMEQFRRRWRRSSNDREKAKQLKRSSNRSRSQSQNKTTGEVSDERTTPATMTALAPVTTTEPASTTTTPPPPPTTSAASQSAAIPTTSTAFSMKEKWLKQQLAQPPPPPPPNGFIGREA